MIKNPKLAVLLMVKDEEARLHVTLESIKGTASFLVMYDTGSTDKTIQIATEFCEKNNIKLRLLIGTFENFCKSRNVSLDFADSFADIDYVLLMDSNDELKGGDILLKELRESPNMKIHSGFQVTQKLWIGNGCTELRNARLFKVRKGWRYKGAVHEYMTNPNSSEDHYGFVSKEVVLHQDRAQDMEKSSHRYSRDKEMLLAEHTKHPTDSRTLFYLAQTCECLNQYEEALKYFKLRIELENFPEERFHAYIRAGSASVRIGNPWSESMNYYMEAINISASPAINCVRLEPILSIALHYKNNGNNYLAYQFLKIGCKLETPAEVRLFIDRNLYEYERWHNMGIISWWVGKYKMGKYATEKALDYYKRTGKGNFECDTRNHGLYVAKLKELGMEVKEEKEEVKEEKEEKEEVKENIKAKRVNNKKKKNRNKIALRKKN